ncbi:hypothetical protein AB4Z18_04730 [Leifsonia sp. 2TAF2]|uniref:hypothetical protein n=1 Tax=Leifsonia sp. 2TAF2 TaxID=3233009 RepID=UPI003F9D6ECB
MARYLLEVPGFARRSTWGYNELDELLVASVLPDDAPDSTQPALVTAVTIDQLLDRIDLATGSRHGMARMVLLLGRAEVREPVRSWLASRIRLVTDRALLGEAAGSDAAWLAAEARNHPLFERAAHDAVVCPECGASAMP